MSLVAPYKVSLNTEETAVILTDSNSITRIIQRGSFVPSEVGTTDISVTFIVNGKSESIRAAFAQWQDSGGTPLAANQYDTLVALSNFMGFKLGGGSGAVTSVNSILPIAGDVTVNLDSVLAEGTSVADGTYTISVNSNVGSLVTFGSSIEIYGTTALVAGTATVNYTGLTINSVITVTATNVGTFNGRLRITRNANSFTITSTDLADTAQIMYKAIL